MRKILLILAAIAVVGVIAAPRNFTESSNYVYGYVSVDADSDGKVSVGDTIRWFVSSDSDARVNFNCWEDASKTVQTQSYTTPVIEGPSTGFGTDASVVVTSAGYCESEGRSGSNRFGYHWFPVIP